MVELFLLIDGVKTKILKFSGSKAKKNLLVLHGWGGSSKSWKSFGKILSENGFNVYVPDLPGFGETPLNRVFTIDDYAEFVEKLVAELGLVDFILMGHSNGGAISIKLAFRGKIKIQKLVLNNSAGIRKTPALSVKRSLFKLVVVFLKPLKKIYGFSFLRIFFYKIIGSQDYLNAEEYPLLKATYQNMISSDLQEEMKHLQIEALIIWGEQDTYTPLVYGEMIKKFIKHSKIVVLKGQRHSIHLTNPGLLATTFLNSI